MEEEEGLSISEVFKVIFKKVWWVLGATILGLVAAVLIVSLWYNTKSRNYVISYEVVFPGSNTGKYPDGTAVLISDSISLNTLTGIKEGKYSDEGSEDEFKDVDVYTMAKSGDISLSANVKQVAENVITPTYNVSYTLTVPAKYFESKDQAESFMRKVAKYPVNHLLDIIDKTEYGIYFKNYEAATSYKEQFTALESQKKYLEEVYNSLKELGESVVSANLAELQGVFTADQQEVLANQIIVNHYVLKPDTYEENAEARKVIIDKKINDNNKLIESFQTRLDATTGGDQSNTPYKEEITRLERENKQLDEERIEIDETKQAIEKYTDKTTEDYAKKVAFDKKVEEYRQAIEQATTKLQDTYKFIYENSSRIGFPNDSITRKGGLNVVVAAIVGAVAGFAVAAVVICIIDLPKYKKQKRAAALSNNGGEQSGEKELENEQADNSEPAKDNQTDKEELSDSERG